MNGAEKQKLIWFALYETLHKFNSNTVQLFTVHPWTFSNNFSYGTGLNDWPRKRNMSFSFSFISSSSSFDFSIFVFRTQSISLKGSKVKNSKAMKKKGSFCTNETATKNGNLAYSVATHYRCYWMPFFILTILILNGSFIFDNIQIDILCSYFTSVFSSLNFRFFFLQSFSFCFFFVFNSKNNIQIYV